jgi:diaminopimelate epimerase
MLAFTKAHAYGNDFLYVREAELTGQDHAAAAIRLCDRHTGIGADGLIVFTPTARGASMSLRNADGGKAELSGNGLRGLAAIIVRDWRRAGQNAAVGVEIQTAAGLRTLTLTGADGSRYVFDADMGRPEAIRQVTLSAAGESVTATVLTMGNPQLVVLTGHLPDDERFARLGPALERHPAFPAGTNVEFAVVEAPDRVRMRIWERGVGPTASSGTGSCAAAVAAAAHGGAARRVEVIAPGGSQVVDWTDEGVRLSGWAEILCDGTFEAVL